MTRRPFGRVNSSNAMRPAAACGVCAGNVAGSSNTRTNKLRMGSGLHGKKRKRVGFEDSLVLFFRKRQGQELVDVLPEISHARTGPIGAPKYAVGDLRQAGKVLQQLGGRNARHVESDFPMTSQDEKRLLHVQPPTALPHPQL